MKSHLNSSDLTVFERNFTRRNLNFILESKSCKRVYVFSSDCVISGGRDNHISRGFSISNISRAGGISAPKNAEVGALSSGAIFARAPVFLDNGDSASCQRSGIKAKSVGTPPLLETPMKTSTAASGDFQGLQRRQRQRSRSLARSSCRLIPLSTQ